MAFRIGDKVTIKTPDDLELHGKEATVTAISGGVLYSVRLSEPRPQYRDEFWMWEEEIEEA